MLAPPRPRWYKAYWLPREGELREVRESRPWPGAPSSGLSVFRGGKLGKVSFLRSRLSGLPEARPTGATLRQLGDAYSEILRDNPTASESTRKTHRRVRALVDGDVSQEVAVEALPDHPTPGDVQGWLSALQATGRYGATTLTNYRNAVSSWYTNGQASGWSQGNPANGSHACFRFVGRARTAETPPSAAEPGALAAVVQELEPREVAYLETMRQLGLRPAEAAGLVGWGTSCDFVEATDGLPAVIVRRQR